MTNINSLNTGHISAANNQNFPTKANNTNEEAVANQAQVQTKEVSEKDTFAFMANNAAYNMGNVSFSAQALVNKYNSPEAIARIGAMMNDFENGVVAGLAKFEEEIGAMFQGLPEQDQMALAAELFASEAL